METSKKDFIRAMEHIFGKSTAHLKFKLDSADKSPTMFCCDDIQWRVWIKEEYISANFCKGNHAIDICPVCGDWY